MQILSRFQDNTSKHVSVNDPFQLIWLKDRRHLEESCKQVSQRKINYEYKRSTALSQKEPS